MIGELLLRLARSTGVRSRVVDHPRVAELAVAYIVGTDVEAAVAAAGVHNGRGLLGMISLVGRERPDAQHLDANVTTYLELIDRLSGPMAADNEITVTPALLGLTSGLAAARPRLVEIVTAAHDAGVGVTLGMGEHHVVDATLQLHRELRAIDPKLAVSVQANLRRTEQDCLVLADAGARVRLSAGAYPAPSGVSHRRGQASDLAFVRCLRTLMESSAYPMVATHDRRLIPVAEELAERTGRTASEYEFQMMFGVRTAEQRRLADTGRRCRVYLPFGTDWYDHVTRRFATQPMRCLRTMWGKR